MTDALNLNIEFSDTLQQGPLLQLQDSGTGKTLMEGTN
jgi:hypothetical protein